MPTVSRLPALSVHGTACRDEFLREGEGEDGCLNTAFKGLSRKQKAELMKVMLLNGWVTDAFLLPFPFP